LHPKGAFILPAPKTRLNSLQNGGCFMFTICSKNGIFKVYFFLKMGCLKLHTVNNTDLKISWINKCVTSAKSEKKARSSYLYGFNGKEEDDEVKGAGNSLDFGARIYDARLGRWLSRDPLEKKYSDWSPYNSGLNSPILWVDIDGRDVVPKAQITYDGTSNPTYANELGSTFVDVNTSAVYNKKTNSYDIQVNIRVQYSALFAGPTQFNLDNPGLKEETEAHEMGHFEQIAEVAKSSDITITYAGKRYIGKIDEVFNAAYKDAKSTLDKKYQGKTFNSEQELKDAQKKFDNELKQEMSGILGLATTELQKKITGHQVDSKGQSQPGIEDDANKRAFKTLSEKKQPIQFLNKKKEVKFKGKVLPWKNSDQKAEKPGG
jgi:RHS repeat-associated protein